MSSSAWRAVVALGALSLTGCFDNMYPTENTDWSCSDGGDEPRNLFCQTDNELLRVGTRGALLSAWESETQTIHQTLQEQFEPTVLSVAWESPVYEGDSETDVVYEWADIDSGALGITWCNDAKDGTDECDQHYVRFNIDEGFPVDGVICHETGHGVGLTHGDVAEPQVDNLDPELGCMQTPYFEGGEYELGTHNADLIDSTYPNEDDGAPADA